MASIDMTIRGAGIIGLSIAWEAIRRGASVQIVDPRGAGSGASGGVVGALAPHVPENWNPKKAFQLDSLVQAAGFWRDVDACSDHASGYARCGRIQPLLDANAVALARRRMKGAAELWPEDFGWTVIGSSSHWNLPSPTGAFVAETLSARIHPRRACESLVKALASRGCRITAAGEDEGAVVWASGWEGLRDLSSALGRPVGQPVKGQAALFDLDRRDAPQLFVDGLHVIPHADGTTALGSTTERDTTDLATDGALEALIERGRSLVPELRAASVIQRWSGLRPRAGHRAPLMDEWPGRTGHFIANGGFKIGFGMAPGMAHAIVDLVLEGKSTFPDDFRLDAL